MVVGSLLSGCPLSYGRRRAIILMDLLIILSCSGSLFLNLPLILSMKFVQGYAAGTIVNACDLYIVETCPPNRLGLFGSLVNIGIVTGLSVYFLQGLFIPQSSDFATT